MQAILTPMVREIELSGKELSSKLMNDMEKCVPHIETAMNSISALEFIANFGEYYHTELIPVLMEWQVIKDRFRQPEWEMAYRIKLAEDFFGTIGQLSISLKPILKDGEERLSKLI